MKRLILCAVATVLMAAGSALAVLGPELDGFVGVTVGPDVQSTSFSYGLQGQYGFTELFSVELAGTWIEDDMEEGKLKLWNFAGSGRLTFPVAKMFTEGNTIFPAAEALGFYVGGGAAYNMFKDDATVLDDNVGFQWFLGFDLETGRHGHVFLDYRYNFITLEMDDVSEDHDVGMFRLGAGFAFR
jgi:opacity protein-like surface antigen